MVGVYAKCRGDAERFGRMALGMYGDRAVIAYVKAMPK